MQQTVLLKAHDGYGGRLPPEPVGSLLSRLPRVVFRAVRMRFEGRSNARGRPPAWLANASDIRLIDVSGDDGAEIVLDCPALGAAAPELYGQQQLWSTRPDPSATGLDLVCDVADELAASRQDSPLLDAGLLAAMRSLQGAIGDGFARIEIPRASGGRWSTIDEGVIGTAEGFSRTIPKPVRVRIAGTLDMVRASTGAFAILLDSGAEVPGVLTDGDVEPIAPLLRRRVLVAGMAVFRPSGNLLRVEAEWLREAPDAPAVWSEMPFARPQRVDRASLARPQGKRSGMAAIFGAWPGDETDDEIAAILEEIS